MRKNFEHLANFFNYIFEHTFCILLIILFLVLSGIILIHLPQNNPDNIESQQILIFGVSLDNWGIWYTATGLIITAIWSMYQFNKNSSRKQQEKGAEIAKEFSSGLLTKCGILTIVYKKSPLYKLLNSHKEYDSFKNFTISELRDIYGNDFQTSYRELERQCNLDNIYHDVLRRKITSYKKSTGPIGKIKLSDKEIRELYTLNNIDLPFHFMGLVDEVLNELEYLCMDISSQAAGSKYIYQSLHQIFFRTIKVLSIEICLRNDGKYCDKFYTNIIHVYNEWKIRYEKDLKKEGKRLKRVDKTLNPKIKTV